VSGTDLEPKPLAIEVEGLDVSLGGRRILHDIHLRIRRGEMVALIGPNGAGKTTLLRCLLGLIPSERGRIRLLGWDKLEDALPRMGYVPQRLALDTGLPLSVREFLALRRPGTRSWFFQRNRTLDAAWPSRVAELGVVPLLDRPLGALSGGQLQRVLIAFSLLGEPELLILDEPTEGVDAPGEQTFYEILGDIHRRLGLTMILVSHDLSMVHRHATWVVAINGRLCCEGPPDAIIQEDALREAYGLQVTPFHHHATGTEHVH
jgi:ABC-type Mn2+/Zn2+ transport system ATPase subunit